MTYFVLNMKPYSILLRRFISIVCGVTVSLVITILLMEGILRIWQPPQLRVFGAKIALQKDVTITNDYKFKTDKVRSPVIIHKNSLGFRGPEPPVNFSMYKTIVAVGGSTTICELLSDGFTWVDYVYKGLNAQYPSVWMNNAGINGHSSFGHIMLLNEYLIKLRPNYMLVLVGVNDMAIHSETSWDTKQRPSDAIIKKSFLESASQYSKLAAYVLYLTSKKGEYLVMQEKDYSIDKNVLGVSSSYLPLTEEEIQKYQPSLKAYKNRLETIVQISREHLIKPIFITQPALYGFGIDGTTGVDLGEMTVRDFSDNEVARKGSDKWAVLQMYNGVTIAVGNERQVPVIDLAGVMPKDSRYYTDYIHFSEAGAEKVGELLLPKISALFAGGY